ncbi:MAG: YceI family protein [Acidobacteria bacterium]|nr:YceI family protein [Acidobacteriota bacterium]
MKKTLLAVFAAAAIAAPAGAQQADVWTIDAAHSSAQFAVKHMMVSTVRGTLGQLTGTIAWDGRDVKTIRADIAIDVAGLDTGVDKRDEHLRSADFFDAANHPAITFTSKRVVPGAAGAFKLVGDLTIRGNTKEVALEVEGPSAPQKMGNNVRSGATATGTINRKEFGLAWSRLIETGGAVVGDEVRMTIDVEATRPAVPAAQD